MRSKKINGVKRYQIEPEKLMDYLTREETSTTFLPNTIFSDPKKAAKIERIAISKEGTVDVYLKGRKYPHPGYPDRRWVKTICIIKKMSMILMDLFASMANRRGIIKLVILRKNIKDLAPKMLVLFATIIGSRRLKERYYNRLPREVYRVFNILIEREDDPGVKEKWIKIRDIVCLILQFDAAYGYRIQDALSEIDVKKIKMTRRDLYYAKSNNYRFGGIKRYKKDD